VLEICDASGGFYFQEAMGAVWEIAGVLFVFENDRFCDNGILKRGIEASALNTWEKFVLI